MSVETTPIELSAALTRNGRTAALIDGAIAPQGVRWHVTELTPGEMFFRQLKFAEFDVSELSLSSFIIGAARGNTEWLAIPVFTTHEFFHTGILVRADSQIRDAADLRGRTLGVLEYQQTSVIWIRGILQHEFGVRDTDVDWVMERPPEKSHGGVTGFAPPAGVRLRYVASDSSLAAMLMSGAIDAILFYPDFSDAIDRRSDGARQNLRTRLLFADPAAEEQRFFAKTGILPVNHGMVVRRSLAEAHPWLARSIYDACSKANTDPAFAYGLAKQRQTLTALTHYLYEQRMTDRIVGLDELFAPSTLDT
jgi:4,5-dihydroxyphthalate decarboxylase